MASDLSQTDGIPNKRCPFCAELIPEPERRCRYCNEYLDPSLRAKPLEPCETVVWKP